MTYFRKLIHSHLRNSFLKRGLHSTNSFLNIQPALSNFNDSQKYSENEASAKITNRKYLDQDIGVLEVENEGNTMDFDLMWLRDNCKCPKCWDGVTLQRIYHHIDLDPELAVKEMTMKDDQIHIQWDKENHNSQYSLKWLTSNRYPDPNLNYNNNKKLWNASILGRKLENLPRIKYKNVMESDGMKRLVMNLRDYGLAFVEETPVNSEATELLCKKIGPIRNTHYGTFWEFEANLMHNDAAYQNFKLEPHTDTTYFTDPAGLQIFHLLSFDGEGGEQIYMDGFLMANNFKEEYPEEYKLLAQQPVPFHSAGDEGQYLTTKNHTIFEHEVAGDIESPLLRLRYNYDSRSVPKHNMDSIKMRQWYLALNKFIKSQHQNLDNRVYFPLEKGTTIIIDNYRVLHGRNAFTANKRKLCGAYINHDDLISQWNIIMNKDKKSSI
ncbi:Trimethyllysine dioxygenase [Neoconidiobolus thromboides FSU 785]|nr:Trimethyllysine dioxygenase [Neoconidiobolus thromboides FSU 785]